MLRVGKRDLGGDNCSENVTMRRDIFVAYHFCEVNSIYDN